MPIHRFKKMEYIDFKNSIIIINTGKFNFSDTYMNLSGSPVKDIISHFGSLDKDYIKNNLLIAADELDANFGKFRIKNGGSANGHNGVKGIFK